MQLFSTYHPTAQDELSLNSETMRGNLPFFSSLILLLNLWLLSYILGKLGWKLENMHSNTYSFQALSLSSPSLLRPQTSQGLRKWWISIPRMKSESLPPWPKTSFYSTDGLPLYLAQLILTERTSLRAHRPVTAPTTRVSRCSPSLNGQSFNNWVKTTSLGSTIVSLCFYLDLGLQSAQSTQKTLLSDQVLDSTQMPISTNGL